MPIGLHPNKTVRVHLDSDVAAFPDATSRPTFIVRFPTANQRAEIAEHFARFDAARGAKEKISAMVDAAKVIVTGWENIPGMTWENIADFMHYDELDDLTSKMLVQTRLTEDDRKNSGSPSATAGGGSAPARA